MFDILHNRNFCNDHLKATTNPNTKKWQQLKAEDPTKKRDFQVRVCQDNYF